MLQFTNKKGASILYKVVKSARANALHNGGYSQDVVNASVVRIEVGKGMNLKRIRFTSRSRMSYYNKYRAHVRVSLLTDI
ncbi:MAG: uL22 family ribosomal protein [Candidatus Absconditabacterales bacterium]|nr:uL22 family ribosomal protein [Candidatus Absconditabacterales bacterium]